MILLCVVVLKKFKLNDVFDRDLNCKRYLNTCALINLYPHVFMPEKPVLD